MKKRKHIPRSIESEILVCSRRRCCLCAFLNGDLREKVGQIAHLDHNSENSDISNLVFLCFEHHDRYDSLTSQSKGITITEIIQYRAKLYEWANELDQNINSNISKRHQFTLGIPWAFELYYPRIKMLFRISPMIYDLLQNHLPNDFDLYRAIEDPVHTFKGCYQLLEPQEFQRESENFEDYLKRCTLPKYCPRCKLPTLNSPSFFHGKIQALNHASIVLSSLKLGVFKDVRRLISTNIHLIGRIPIQEWNHSVSLSFSI